MFIDLVLSDERKHDRQIKNSEIKIYLLFFDIWFSKLKKKHCNYFPIKGMLVKRSNHHGYRWFDIVSLKSLLLIQELKIN